MSRVTLSESGNVNIDFHNEVGYIFCPSNGEILDVRIDKEYYKKNKVMDMLVGTASVLRKKDNRIHWCGEQLYRANERGDRFQNLYKKMKTKVYISLVFNILLVFLLIYLLVR